MTMRDLVAPFFDLTAAAVVQSRAAAGRASNPNDPTVNAPSKEVHCPLLSQPIPDLAPVQYARPGDRSNGTLVTRLSNGLRVVSENHFEQFCTVGVVIDFEPRYELCERGVPFRGEGCYFQGIRKHGGICDCQSSRYATISDSRGLESVPRILADVVLRSRLAIELARQSVNFELETLWMRLEQKPVLMDIIHATAFRYAAAEYADDEPRLYSNTSDGKFWPPASEDSLNTLFRKLVGR